jgi:hypothetical protein
VEAGYRGAQQRKGGYEVKKYAKVLLEGPFKFFECGFCQHRQSCNEIMPWCAGCFNEYELIKKGGAWKVESDDQRRTPRFFWAKAIGRAGGAQIGPTREETQRQKAAEGEATK